MPLPIWLAHQLAKRLNTVRLQKILPYLARSNGEYSRHSGAALSGKDPTRIDRVGAYVARYAAKNVVAAGLADECEVQLSYSIGLSRPVSIQVETFGTGKIPDEDITALLDKHFDFRLAGTIREFNLRFLPAIAKGWFYRELAGYGHVGRIDLGTVPWEKTDKGTPVVRVQSSCVARYAMNACNAEMRTGRQERELV